MNKMINDLYKIAVVSMMSSGKSTFINSILGKEILPAKNIACTGNILEVFNKNDCKHFYAEIENTFEKIKLSDSSYVEKLNNNEINEMKIIGKFFNVKNNKKQLVLIDTPGINNSLDCSHGIKTYDYLKKFNNGMIIYIINATQFGINDDKNFLSFISQLLKDNKKIKIMFLVNKIDEIDQEIESISDFLFKVKIYIENLGVNNFQLIAISALAALLFRRALNNEMDKFTRKEVKEFCNYIEFWKSEFINERKFLISKNEKFSNKKIFFNNQEYSEEELKKAIQNTGISIVEELISRELKGEY